MSPQILITGATGFIGRQLTRDLVTAGRSVRVLARDRRKARALFGDEIEIVTGDLGDLVSLRQACAGIETVHHIAGMYRFGLKHRREVWQSNVEGTENLLRCAHEAGVGRFVHLSSGGVLRKKPGASTTLLSEEDFPAQPPRFGVYKLSKWHSEQRVLAWVQRGLPAVIASTTCPIGRGDEMPTPTGRMIRDFLDRRFPFYCRTGLNFISVRDLSQGLQQAAELGRPGERYLLSDENIWLKEFLDLLEEETGCPSPKTCLPNWTVRVIGAAGEAVDWLDPRSVTARVCLETSAQADQAQFFSNAKARRELAWQPTVSIRQGVREALAWFRHEPEVERPTARAASLETHVR